jgi:HSP20 family protein
MLVRWNDHDHPMSSLDALRRYMDRLFDDQDRASLFQQPGAIPVSLFDTEQALIFSFDVPGLGEKDFTLSLAQNVLTLQGERRLGQPEGYTTHRQERSSTRFSRSFALPYRVDPERTTAALKDGILTVTLPKTSESKARTISVRAE